MALLFLDFDGVLHPVHSNKADCFCMLDNFEAVMREFPGVRIVIASTWRQAYSFAHLKSLFSADIAARIIGKTPDWEEDGDEHVRFKEIRQFLKHPSLAGMEWIAVDDSDFEFPESCRNVLLCDPRRGFDNEMADKLRGRLNAMSIAPV
jgi:HAD domain in Swiss Army Knife RNA repair proteins